MRAYKCLPEGKALANTLLVFDVIRRQRHLFIGERSNYSILMKRWTLPAAQQKVRATNRAKKENLSINWIVRGYRGVVFNIGTKLINVALRQRGEWTLGMVQIANRHGFIDFKGDGADALPHFTGENAR